MKKRILSIMLALCMVIMLMPQAAFAETYGDYKYSLTDGKATITSYNGSDEVVTIPDTLGGYPVKAIGMSAFYNKTGIRKIVIPDSVTSIEQFAFYDCISLESINIPANVTSIENAVFMYCKSLKSINIPDGVTSIKAYAFCECRSLESINIPDSVTSIKAYAFQLCESLKNVTIPDAVTSIENFAFNNCFSLESINIPSGVTSIANSAFYDCKGLKSITIPDGVTSIESSAFSGCKSLESVTIPDSVTSIGTFAFKDCKSFKRIIIPHKVTTISNYTFSGCNNLESVFLSENVTSIGVSAIPDTASQIRYSLDETNGEATITKIELADGKENVDIPEKIFGYPIAAVATSEQSKVGAHTCKGGTATCTKKAECALCGKEYGELADHTFTAETINEDALKAAGSCTTKAVYYYSCSVCGEVESDDNHTFTGEKDPDNHTGKLVWDKNNTRHKQYYNCCNKVTVAVEDHDWENGVCSECDYACEHSYEWQSGEGKYWQKCSVCGIETAKTDLPELTIDAPDKVCRTQDCEISVLLPDSIVDAQLAFEFDHLGEGLNAEVKDGKISGVLTADGYVAEDNSFVVKIYAETDDGYLLTASKTVEIQNEHSGGEATCTEKAVCEVCGKEYSDFDPDNHTGEQVWTQTEKQHEKKWDCCDEITVSAEAHSWENGVCSECDYACEHFGGTATCTKKAVCKNCGMEYGELDSTNHELEHVPAKAATTSQTGNKEYWHCKNCGKYFSDKDGKNEITLKDVEIAKLAPESKPQNTSSTSTSTAVKTDESPSTGNGGSPLKTMLLIMSGGVIFAAWACGKKKNAKAK